MATLLDNLNVVWNILKVVFGLGFIIFLHELGHFLAAKWNGVKVEKFFLGFDPYGLRVATFTYGETTYGIGAIPLGGYVKMLGEDPGEGEERSSDPRAFGNKSVGARTMILSAGVLMNLLLGFIIFTITQMLGVTIVPARLGFVQAGSPAYEAGLRPGDEIVTIDGRGDVNFMRLKLKVSLSGPKQVLNLGVKRPGVPELLNMAVAPKRGAKSTMPTIGIAESDSLTLAGPFAYRPPAGADGPTPPKDAFPAEGKVVEAGPVGGPIGPVANVFELDRVLADHRDKPVEITIESPGDGASKSNPKRTKVTLPVTREMTLGLRMTPGPVASIQAGSVAEKAGFAIGDRILSVDGEQTYDPIQLPDQMFGKAGKPVTFKVSRQVEGKPTEITLTATPSDALTAFELASEGTAPMKIPGLGLAMTIEPKIAAVAEGSPAAKHGIQPGAVLKTVKFPADKSDPTLKPHTVVFEELAKPAKDVFVSEWSSTFRQIQDSPRRELWLTFEGSATPVAMTPEPDPSRFLARRGLRFFGVTEEVPPQPLGIALKRGLDETYDNVVSIYAMIRSLFQGRVSPKNLAGVPRIADIAYRTASMGIVPLLSFLGMLSINLAVLNFLPIPPLDGGQIAFLVAEKIRGKPLPESTLVVLMIAGIALVGCLMLYTIIQDVYLMIFG